MIAEAIQIPAWMITLFPILVIGIVVNFFWQGFITYSMHVLSKKDRSVEAVEQRLHEANVKLIDERFRSVTHQVVEHANAVALKLQELRVDLKELDDAIQPVFERAHAAEMKSASMVGEVKEYMIEQLKEIWKDERRAREGER